MLIWNEILLTKIKNLFCDTVLKLISRLILYSNEEENEKQTTGNVDMWELQSMKSSSLSKATGHGVINPMFVKQEEDQTPQ